MTEFELALQALQDRLDLSTDFEDQMNIRDEIVELKKKHGIIKIQECDEFECIGCGS